MKNFVVTTLKAHLLPQGLPKFKKGPKIVPIFSFFFVWAGTSPKGAGKTTARESFFREMKNKSVFCK
jgi:hypothetical protein